MIQLHPVAGAVPVSAVEDRPELVEPDDPALIALARMEAKLDQILAIYAQYEPLLRAAQRFAPRRR